MAEKQRLLERRVGPVKVLTIFMLLMLALAVVIAVIIIVTTVTQNTKSEAAKAKGAAGQNSDDCLDIAIIGAGIGGSYTGWRLGDRNISIAVYEYTDRVGGRLLSMPLPVAPGTYLEFGGMRFLPKTHTIINDTATALGLKIIDFPLGFGPAPERLMYVRGTHLRDVDFFSDKNPYRVKPTEEGPLGPVLWNIFNNNVNFSDDKGPSVDEMYSLVTNAGIPLYKISLDNFYGEYMSREMYDAMLGFTGLTLGVGHHSALFAMSYMMFPGAERVLDTLKTVVGGMEKIPQKLMEEFLMHSDRHKLHLNHQLMKIERADGRYHLHFRQTHTTDGITTAISGSENQVCAKKVVFAAQRDCVEKIDFPGFKHPDVLRMINSVEDQKAGKVFLAYKTPWWKTNQPNITHSKTDLPNGQTFDWYLETNVSVVLATYHDHYRTDLWRELSHFGTPIKGSMPGAYAVTDVVKERLEKYLSEIYEYPLENIPECIGGGMMLWDTYPFNAAWHHYKPGFDEREVQARVLKPSPEDDVFIVSNSWANAALTSWAEGSLSAVEDLLEKHLYG